MYYALANSHLKEYYATVYSAEIVNTFTNLVFVFLAYKGISSCIRYGHERVFLIGFLSYLSIGVGSMFFHSSLKCKAQTVILYGWQRLTFT